MVSSPFFSLSPFYVPLPFFHQIQQIFEVDQTPEGLGIEGIQMQLESQFGVSATVEDTTFVVVVLHVLEMFSFLCLTFFFFFFFLGP